MVKHFLVYKQVIEVLEKYFYHKQISEELKIFKRIGDELELQVSYIFSTKTNAFSVMFMMFF